MHVTLGLFGIHLMQIEPHAAVVGAAEGFYDSKGERDEYACSISSVDPVPGARYPTIREALVQMGAGGGRGFH